MRAVFGLLVTAIVFSGFFVRGDVERAESITITQPQYGLIGKLFKPQAIVFTGDIMLARSVEDIMKEHGSLYPFQNMISFLEEKDLVIGNFEASIPENHIPTLPLTMRFSVDKSYLKALSTTGFDVLSLANNHSYDYGKEGYEHTRTECENALLVCFGNPFGVGTSSIRSIRVGDTSVGLLFLHTLYGSPDINELKKTIDQMQETSDVQFAYIHWGDEYKTVHLESQAELAYYLIDSGVDAIIGHHPHVIQDIELYKGKPIFYSLGNFIFDQYFSDEVQEGYLVEALISYNLITYSLHPHDSKTVRSQPKFLTEFENANFFREVLHNTFFTEDEQKNGTFNIERD